MFEEGLEVVLQRPKYDFLTGRRVPLRQRITEFILDLISRLLELINIDVEFSPHNATGNVVVGLFYVFVAVSILVLLYVILRFYFKRKRRKAIFDDIFTEFKNNKLSFNQLLELSDKCELDKNYKDALRYQYIALIMIFVNKNILIVPDSMTGGQLIQKIKQNANEFLDGTASTVNTFYTLYFGKKSITDEVYKIHKVKYNETIRRVQNYEKG